MTQDIYTLFVHRFFTPLLRRLYGMLVIVLAVYFSVYEVRRSTWNRERLYRQIISGNRQQKAAAAADLVFLGGQPQLLRALKSENSTIRELAMGSLWMLWWQAGGDEAFRLTQEANEASEQRKYTKAAAILAQLVRKFPRFAEGWNRLAILHWQLGQFERSVADCKKVVTLNPDHFAAWQGMGLCQMHLGDIAAACRSLRVALRINPYDRGAQKFLRQCEDLQRLLLPQPPSHGELI